MPIQACELDGKPGFRWGQSGTCYTYQKGDEKGAGEAKRKAHVQGYAIEVNKEAPPLGQAMWLQLLKARVAAFLGKPVARIACVEMEEDGTCIRGMTLTDFGATFDFTVHGPFDIEVPDPTAPPSDPAMLHPFGTDFGPAQPTIAEMEDPDQLWEWAAPTVPVMVQPRVAGHSGILEKKGGRAKLWYQGERGVDQLSKFPALKEYVLKMPQDFVAEVTMGVEKDGMWLDPGEQEMLRGPNPYLENGTKLAIYLEDLMYLNGDMHGEDAAQRYQKLADLHRESFAAQPEFRISPMKEARDQLEIRNAASWAQGFPGSKGAVVKVSGSPYVLTMQDDNRAWIGKQLPTVGIYKAMKEERIVYGVVLRPNVIDAQEDIMTSVDVEKAAHWYMEHGQQVKLRHGRDPVQGDTPLKAVVLESYVAPVDFNLGSGKVLKGDWVMAMRIDDPAVWDKVDSGEYQAFSVGGTGTRQPVA